MVERSYQFSLAWDYQVEELDRKLHESGYTRPPQSLDFSNNIYTRSFSNSNNSSKIEITFWRSETDKWDGKLNCQGRDVELKTLVSQLNKETRIKFEEATA